jgi:hypothetical protein
VFDGNKAACPIVHDVSDVKTTRRRRRRCLLRQSLS